MSQKIKSLKPSRIQNRINILFESGQFIPFPYDQTVALKLHKDRVLADEEYADIISKSLFYLVLAYSLRQVAMSPKTEVVLKPKVKNYLKRLTAKYQINPDLVNTDNVINQAVNVLKDRQLLNQSDYLRFMVRKSKNKSTSFIKYALQKQGVDRSLLDEIESDDCKKILTYLEKKNYSTQDLTDFKTKTKIIAVLYRKGFSLNDVKTAIDVFKNKK